MRISYTLGLQALGMAFITGLLGAGCSSDNNDNPGGSAVSTGGAVSATGGKSGATTGGKSGATTGGKSGTSTGGTSAATTTATGGTSAAVGGSTGIGGTTATTSDATGGVAATGGTSSTSACGTDTSTYSETATFTDSSAAPSWALNSGSSQTGATFTFTTTSPAGSTICDAGCGVLSFTIPAGTGWGGSTIIDRWFASPQNLLGNTVKAQVALEVDAAAASSSVVQVFTQGGSSSSYAWGANISGTAAVTDTTTWHEISLTVANTGTFCASDTGAVGLIVQRQADSATPISGKLYIKSVVIGSSTSTGTGGASSTGGTSSTGTTAVGGTTAAVGGTTAAGGTTSTTTTSGGDTSVGGTTSTTTSSGGDTSVGGTTSATGGDSSTGGTAAATGGDSSTGGDVSTGGTTSATGGDTSTGGTEATGGSTSTAPAGHSGLLKMVYPFTATSQNAQVEFFFTNTVDLSASGRVRFVFRIDNPDNASGFNPGVQGGTGECWPYINTVATATPTAADALPKVSLDNSVWRVVELACANVTAANHIIVKFTTNWETFPIANPMTVYLDSVELLGDGTTPSASFTFDYPTTVTAAAWQASGVFYNQTGMTDATVTSVDTAP